MIKVLKNSETCYRGEILTIKLFMVPYSAFWSRFTSYTLQNVTKKRRAWDHKKFDSKNLSTVTLFFLNGIPKEIFGSFIPSQNITETLII